MKAFDETYVLLQAMRNDDYFPPFLVEKTADQIRPVIQLLASGETGLDTIQSALDEMTLAINDLEEEFEENDSELETAARESIAETVEYILQWYHIDIDTETALREREW